MESIIGKLMHKLKTEHTCCKVATKINIQVLSTAELQIEKHLFKK